MEQKIPIAAAIRGRLALIGYAQTQELFLISGVPFTKLWKIRNGATENPRIEMVGQFWMTEAAKAGLANRRRLVRRADDRAMLAVMKGQGI